MSAINIYENGPLGSLIAWSDGTRRPPKRNFYLYCEWLVHNNRGRLVRTQGERGNGDPGMLPAITLLRGDFTEAGVVANSSLYTFHIDYPLRFTIVERPPIGSVRVFDRPGRDAELVYLARSRAEAEHWVMVEGDRHPEPVLEEVTADEIAAAVVEGRAA